MYQSMLPINTMVQLMNGQQMNVPVAQTQNHALFVNGVNSYYPSHEHTLCSTDASNYNRFRMMQGTYPLSMFPGLMNLEMPSMRRHSYGQYNNGGNSGGGTWPRRSNGLSVHHNFNSNNNNNSNNRQQGTGKKFWYNKNGKRNNNNNNSSGSSNSNNNYRGGQQLNQVVKELQSNDSGFSSRSPTPIKANNDENLTDQSSDDRDSLLSQTDQGIK